MNIQEIKKNAIETLQKYIPETDILFSHSVRTGLILEKMGLGPNTITAGILHHVPIKKLTGEVQIIVKKIYQIKELSEPKKLPKRRTIKQWKTLFSSQQRENVIRMFFVIAQDLRPIFITLAGRLDEMKNLLPSYSKDQQMRKSLIALEVLTPLAYGLGMGEIKGQLEDLAFMYLYPKEYKSLLKIVADKNEERLSYLKETKHSTGSLLVKEGIQFLNIDSRTKHYFSLYRKLLNHDMDINKIYDVVALRIIVPDVTTCYKTLGVIHNKWKPLQGRVKDYIATPKHNGYRSLHTVVFCKHARIVEFQIRTKEMHEEAEHGAAAHLSYEKNIAAKKYASRFYWLEQLRKWRIDAVNANKITEYVKSELFKNKIFVFTPNKEVISLLKDSTPVDFAYAIHSEVGDHCSGAKVNDKMTQLNQKLKTGDTIEILTNKNKSPSLDWLRFTKTHKAKSRIRLFLEKAHGLSFKESKQQSSIIGRVAAIKERLPKLPLKKKEDQITVGGEIGIRAKLSKCCKPKQGDQLQAFITSGEAASIHRADCPNLKELSQKWPQRVVEASWPKQT